MPATIHVVRHAQAVHNLTDANLILPDPVLTPLGREQCSALRERFPHHDQITHLVASPMRRTIETCLLGFGGGKVQKLIALPEIQEVSDAPCDTGTDPATLVAELGDVVDFGLVKDGWNDKSAHTPWEPDFEKLDARGKAARLFLRDLGMATEDAHIVVVTHGAVVHFLTDDWSGIDAGSATGWKNTEFRSFQFVDPTGQDPEARIRETAASRAARKGESIVPTEDEQRELRSVYYAKMRPWLKFVKPIPNFSNVLSGES